MIICAACQRNADPNDFAGNAIHCTCEQEVQETIGYSEISVGEEIECTDHKSQRIHGFVLEKTDMEAKVSTPNGDRYVYPDYIFYKLAA